MFWDVRVVVHERRFAETNHPPQLRELSDGSFVMWSYLRL